MSFDPYAPYGPVVDTTMRIATWNVWGRYGEWQVRQQAIEEDLDDAGPDIVCLAECWSTPETTQPALIAARLGFEHSLFTGDWMQDGWVSGVGVASRWEISFHERRPLHGPDGAAAGEALFALVDGDRGPIQLFVAVLDYPLDGSAVRQAQVQELAAFVLEKARRRYPVVVCGDFNAAPDSDEIRMLTGRSATVAPGLVFYDAWEVAGDGSPGYTWSNDNPLAAMGMYPNRRFDYILSAWPRAGAVGHPVHCERLGVVASGETQRSDHYGVMADLRY